jgi:hypothetical protein
MGGASVPKLRNHSHRGDLDIPLVRRVVPFGHEFDVTDEQARVLLQQPANYAPADDAAKAIAAELAKAAEPAGEKPKRAPRKATPRKSATHSTKTEG